MRKLKSPLIHWLQIASLFTFIGAIAPLHAAPSSERDSGRAEEADLYDRNRLQLDFNPYDYDDNDRRDRTRRQRQGGQYNQNYYNQQNNPNAGNYYYPQGQ